jgi:hypothetical protein
MDKKDAAHTIHVEKEGQFTAEVPLRPSPPSVGISWSTQLVNRHSGLTTPFPRRYYYQRALPEVPSIIVGGINRSSKKPSCM